MGDAMAESRCIPLHPSPPPMGAPSVCNDADDDQLPCRALVLVFGDVSMRWSWMQRRGRPGDLVLDLGRFLFGVW